MNVYTFGFIAALILLTQAACLESAQGNNPLFGDATTDASDSSGVDETQDVPDLLALCLENEYVSEGSCVVCTEGLAAPAGADPNGPNTSCTPDPCFAAFGVLCTQYNQAYIKASNAGEEDALGDAIALDDDTLVVAASFESSSATGINGDQNNDDAPQSGAVYVFVRNNDVWTQQAYIKASNTDTGDRFGAAIALHGDTLVVGAYEEDSNATLIQGDQSDNSATRSGAVYVFTRSGEVWSQQAYLKASNASADDRFGFSVALHDNLLAVGATEEDQQGDGSNNGAVYLFARQGTAWTEQAYIRASNSDVGDEFGCALALHDGTLAVGAKGESSNAIGIDGDQTNNTLKYSGAVYIFTQDDPNTWSQQAYIKASNPGKDDQFGYALDLEQDTLVVGALWEDSSATGIDGDQLNDSAPFSGAAYVFTRSNAEWSQQAYLKASNTNEDDEFGHAISLRGDLLAISAYEEGSNATGVNSNENDNSSLGSGAVYMFARTDNTWAQKAYIKSSRTSEYYSFGTSVALSEDTLAVGAEGESSGARGVNGDANGTERSGSGAAYVRSIAPR